MDLFDKWAKEDTENGYTPGASVRPALDIAADTTADRQVRDMELANSLGFSPEVIAEQREWAEGEDKARTIERNPLFARWAEEDKTNAAFARDDTEKMGEVFEILGGSDGGIDMSENKWAEQVKNDIRKGLLYFNARRGDKAAQEQLMTEAGLTEDEIRYGAYRQTPQPGAIGQLTESFKEGTDQVDRGLLGAMVLLGENLQKDVVTGNATPWAPAWDALARHARGRLEEIEQTTSAPLNAEVLVNDVVRAAPQVFASFLTAYATGGLGAGLFMGAQIAGNQYLDLTEKHDVVFQPARDMDELARLMVEKKHGWQDDDVVNEANMSAARAELIAHAILNTEQAVPAGTAAIASLGSAAVQAPLEAIGLGKLADVFRTTGLGNVVKHMVERVSTEFVTEAIQQHPDEFSRIWAEGTARGESWNDIWGTYISRFGEITKEGLYSGLVAAPFGVLGGLARVSTDARLAREARDWLVAQRVFKQKVDETKAAQVAPIVMQRALESGGMTGEVYIPASEVLRLHQEGVPVLERMGWDVEDVQVEAERGGEMTAKLARMHSFMEAKDFDAVMQFSRPAAGAWSMAEAEQFDARVKEDVDKLVADAVSDDVERSAIDAETARIEAEMRQSMQSIPGLRTEIKGTGSLTDIDPKAQDTMESAVTYNMQVIRAMAARFSASGMPASDFLSRIHLQGMQMDERGRLLTPEEMRQHMQNVEEREASILEAEALRPFWEKVWHRVDPASLKKDWPEAEHEFRKMELGGMFRTAKAGGLPIDQIADELGMDADTLVEKLKTMQRPRRGYYQEGVTADVAANSHGVPMDRVTFFDRPFSRKEMDEALAALAGQNLENKLEGLYAQVNLLQRKKLKSAKAIDKSIDNGFGGGVHLSFAAKIRNLWAWAARATPDKDALIQRFVAPIRIGEEDNFAWITVKNSTEGLRLYSLELMDKEKLARTSQHVSTEDPKVSPLASFEEIIERLNRPVNAESDTLYQEMNQSITRGVVEIAKGQEYTIQLLKDANLSTVLHETGHIMLAEMEHLIRSGMANEALARDYQTIRDWLGLKDGDNLASLTDPRMVAANEKFAKGMELYLREGKAPSRNLESAFARFKRWLTRIYRDIVNDPYFKGVTLNDDVREVFDRLLANENEIARVSEKVGISDSMRAELDALGLQGAERARVTSLIQEAQEEAADELQKARDAHRTAQLSQWRKEAADIIKEEPEYKALQTMRSEGLNLDSVVQLGGEEMKNRLLKRMPGSVRKDGMLSPEIVAWESGFETAEEMVAAVAAYPTFKDRQKHIIQQKQEEHDAQFDIESFLYETDALAASEELLAVRIAEIMGKRRYKAELSGQTVGRESVQPTEEQAQDYGRSAQYQASRERIKELAAESLRGSRVRDAMNPEKFRQTVRRMIREERRALMRQDWEAALVANYQLRLNMELARQSARMRTNMEKFETKLKKFLKNEKNDPNARYAVSRLGVPLGLVPVTSIVNRTAQGRDFKDVEAWARAVEDEGFPVLLNMPLWVNGNDVLWRDMTLAEFEDWHNELKMIVNVETERRKVNTSRGKLELAQFGEEMAASIRAHNPNADTSKVQESGKVRQALEAFHAEHMKADSIAMLADGDQMGIVWESIIKPINDATYDEQIRFKDVKQKLDEMFKVYERENLIDMRQKRVFVQSLNNGKGEFITKENALCALLNLGNESNRERLMNGMEWNEAQLKDVLTLLDERDWDFAQKVWDYLESFREESFALEERMTGVKPTSIPAQPIISPFGKTYRGGYYPVKYNSRKSTRGVSPEDRMQGHGAAFAQVEHGSMKERVGGGLGAPLDLRLGVLEQHLARTVHNLAFREAVTDVGRILRQPDFKAAFTETAGTAQYKALQSWLNDVASMQNQDMGGLGKAASWARERMALYTMGFKVSTMLAQLTGGLSSCLEIGPTWMLKGSAKVFGHGVDGMVKAYKEAMELSPMMQNRITSFEREVNTATRKLMDYGSTNKLFDPVKRVDGWIREHAYVPMGYCQLAVDLPTFWGAFEKAMAENGGDVKKAVTSAEHTVETTQVGGATKDLAAIQRHGEVMKLFTMYYSYFSCLYNLSARRITMAARHGDLPHIMRLAGLSMLWFVEPLISAALTGKLPDEDEDWEEAETWAKWGAQNALLNPLSMVVGVRDIVRFEQNLIEGKPFGFRASPAFDLVETLGRAAAVPAQVIFDDKELTQGRVKTVAKGLGMAAGSPLFGAQTITTLFNMWDVMDGTEEFRFRDLLFARQK